MRLSDDRVCAIQHLLSMGMPIRRIAVALKVSRRTIRRVQYGARHDDPTPEEIAEACRRIRSGWSEETRRKRLRRSEA